MYKQVLAMGLYTVLAHSHSLLLDRTCRAVASKFYTLARHQQILLARTGRAVANKFYSLARHQQKKLARACRAVLSTKIVEPLQYLNFLNNT